VAVKLQSHVELDMFILAPFALVLVQGMMKLMNFIPLAVMPLVMSVECAT